MCKKIIILGTGGNCVDILDAINEINKSRSETYECIGFLDDNEDNWGKTLAGIKVLGALDTAPNYNNCYFINGIGSPFNFWKKESIISRTKIPGERFATIIHPSASISSMSRLNYGTVVFQNVTITSNVEIGKHVIILPNAVVSHDSTIGDYTCIAGSVSISGGVAIRDSCYLGTNSSIIGNVEIGNKCLVGMGSVVIKSIKPNSVVAGNPARFIRESVPASEN